MTDTNFPSVQDLCKLILTCRKYGVSHIKYGSAEINFSGSAPGPAQPAPQKVIEEQSHIQKEVLAKEELSTREDQIAELLITDPLLAEELMEMGELEKGDDGSSSRD